jgi:hypothetical protein
MQALQDFGVRRYLANFDNDWLEFSGKRTLSPLPSPPEERGTRRSVIALSTSHLKVATQRRGEVKKG